MKKLLIVVLSIMMLSSLTACGTQTPSQASQSSAIAAKDSALQSESSATWKIKVGETELTEKDFSSLTLVTQKVKKQTKDGGIKEHECIGYTLKSILDYAKVSDFSRITAVSADGSQYEIKSAIATLPTTMLTVKQDGEAYKVPRLAIDGEGSKAWLTDIKELKVQK